MFGKFCTACSNLKVIVIPPPLQIGLIPKCQGAPSTPADLWLELPESVVLQMLHLVSFRDVLSFGATCRLWNRLAYDQLLWRHLFYTYWKIDRSIPMARDGVGNSWLQEFIRLHTRSPVVECEVIRDHADQVNHISFSNNGKMFSTCSKDAFVRVWINSQPVTLRHVANMKTYTWQFTQFSQFNKNDTLLLVSGVLFGYQSTSGEIAVFSLKEFALQSRVMNKPHDVFGTWLSESYLLSGNFHVLTRQRSCSVLWLNKATQEIKSEDETVVLQLFKFINDNHSAVRSVKVANNPLIAMYDSLYNGSLPKIEEMPAHHRGSLSPFYRPLQDDQTSNSYFGNSETFSDSESWSRGRGSWLGMVHFEPRPATSCAVYGRSMSLGPFGVNSSTCNSPFPKSDLASFSRSNSQSIQSPISCYSPAKIMGSVSTAMLTGDEVEFPRNDSNYHHWDFLGETYSQSTKCRNADDTTDIENHESSSAIGSFSNSNENDAELGSLLTTEDEIDLGSDDFSEKQTLEIVEGAIPIPVPSKKMGNDASFSTLDATPKIGTSSSNPDLSYNGTIVPGTLVESWYNSTESSTGGVVDDEAQMEPRLSSNGSKWSGFSFSQKTQSSLDGICDRECKSRKQFVSSGTATNKVSRQVSLQGEPKRGADSYSEDTESLLDVEARGGDVLDILSGYATDTEGGAESSWEVESMRNFPRRPRLAHNPSGITMPLLEEGALLLGHDYITRPSLVIKEPLYLVFTLGCKAFIPHQLGLKRVSPEATNVSAGSVPIRDNEHEFDDVDHVISFDGHIVGYAVSPDHRYAYVNVRNWLTKDASVQDPLKPPPISQNVSLYVLDLVTRQLVPFPPLTGHRAFTPAVECLFLFLDVSKDFVASGSENKQGYIWDRHYRCIVGTLPHNDVVSCVTFNPVDQEMAVTVSDDHTVKVWRSRNQMRRLRKDLSVQPTAPVVGESVAGNSAENGPGCSMSSVQIHGVSVGGSSCGTNVPITRSSIQTVNAQHGTGRKLTVMESTESSESDIFD